ncbi:Scr1 family TA system antitoxin-like transcriptional regulator [Streptomyces vinaceus]|uniref:helix-turn-helix domain-containing protein n=1 Tax=Streptomyces vinaceus TaxID=1960 RepID=UPI0035DFF557
MPAPKELDPSASLAALYGAKLRKLRIRAGLTQRQLGDKIPIAHSRIAQFELGNEVPPEDVNGKLDVLLDADGDLVDLWSHVKPTPYPQYARRFMDLEPKAVKMLKFLSQVVPGLLQTQAYARAQMRIGNPREFDVRIEEWVRARLERQLILRSSKPPLLWCILDEAVLRRPIGGPAVMAEQLAILVAWAQTPHVVVQVLPFAAGGHPMLMGSLSILSFKRGPDVAYVEGSYCGELLKSADEVARYALAYDLLQASALSPDESLAVIHGFMEEYRACALREPN